MSNPAHDNPHGGSPYGGQAIRLTNQRRTVEPQGRPPRRRYAAPPAPTHRQGHSFGIHPSDDSYSSDSFGLVDGEEEEGDEMDGGDYPGSPARAPTSAVRYTMPVPPRQRETVNFAAKPTKVFSRRSRFGRRRLVFWLCVALIVMIGGWWLLSWVSNWWQGVQDNLQYGSPRTFQADQYVGLGDSPAHPDHFIALNLHGVIEVVQINPQDSTRDAVYVLTSVGNPGLPARLSFQPDATGSGRMDVVVTIGDSAPYSITLLNNGKTLQPAQAEH